MPQLLSWEGREMPGSEKEKKTYAEYCPCYPIAPYRPSGSPHHVSQQPCWGRGEYQGLRILLSYEGRGGKHFQSLNWVSIWDFKQFLFSESEREKKKQCSNLKLQGWGLKNVSHWIKFKMMMMGDRSKGAFRCHPMSQAQCMGYRRKAQGLVWKGAVGASSKRARYFHVIVIE